MYHAYLIKGGMGAPVSLVIASLGILQEVDVVAWTCNTIIWLRNYMPVQLKSSYILSETSLILK